MDLSSWLRSALTRNPKSKPISSSLKTQSPAPSQTKPQLKEEELGVTEELQKFIKSLTIETFKDFSLQDDQVTSSSNGDSSMVQKDLNEWQERHATLVLSKVKEISQLRYVLCPRHLKERQFWRIYFSLVKSYVAPYEIRAIRDARLRRLGREEETLNTGFEVEMAETKTVHVSPDPWRQQ